MLIRQNLSRISRRVYKAGLRRTLGESYIASMDEPEFADMLWKCSVVQGGYHFVYEQEDGSGIKEELFNEDGIAVIYFLALMNGPDKGFVSCCNGIWVSGQGEKQENLYLQGIRTAKQQEQVQHLAEGGKTGLCFALEEEEEPPMSQPGDMQPGPKEEYREWLTRNNYHIAAYRILENQGFLKSGWSYPLVPAEYGTYRNYYQAVIPLSEYARGQVPGPYAGLGQKAEIELAFRDIYGNQDAGRKVITFSMLYQDALYDMTKLPFTKWEYDLEEPGKGGRQIAVLSFEEELYNRPKEGGAYERLRDALWQYCQTDVRMTFSSGFDKTSYEIDKEAVLQILGQEKEVLNFLSGAVPCICSGASVREALESCRGSFEELGDEERTLKELFAKPEGLFLPEFIEVAPQMPISGLTAGKHVAEQLNKNYPLRLHAAVETEEFKLMTGEGVHSFEKAARDNNLPLKELIQNNQEQSQILREGFSFKWKAWETKAGPGDSMNQICTRLQAMSGENVEADVLVLEEENKDCLKEQAVLLCRQVYTRRGDTLGQNAAGLSMKRFLELNEGCPGILEPGGVLYTEEETYAGEFMEEGIDRTAIAYHMEPALLWQLWQDKPLREGISFCIGRRFCLPEKLPGDAGHLYKKADYKKGGHQPGEFSEEILRANAWVCQILDDKTVFIQEEEIKISKWETFASLTGRLQERFAKTAEEIWTIIKGLAICREEFVYLVSIESIRFYFPMVQKEEMLLPARAGITVARTGRLPQDAPEDVKTVTGSLQILSDEDGSQKGFIGRMEKHPGLHAAWDEEGGLLAAAFNSSTVSGIRISADDPVYAALRPLTLQLMTRKGVKVPQLLEDGTLAKEEGEADFSDIDMEIWAQEFLNDFDRILNMNVFRKPAQSDKGQVNEILACKEKLAGVIAGQLTGLAKEGMPAAVKEKIQGLLKDRLRESLTEGYAQSVWIAMPMECSSAMRCRFPLTVDGGEGIEIFSGKADTEDKTGYFVMQMKPKEKFITSLMPGLSGRIVDMEYDIVMREDGYENSRWITFDSPLEDERLDVDLLLREPVPVPLRQVPQEPCCISHGAVFCQEGEKLLDYCRWDYAAVYEHRTAMQDELELTVHFMEEDRLRRMASGKDLFDLLAGYKAVRDTLLGQLEAGNQNALASFKELAADVVTGWEEWGTAGLKRMSRTGELKFPMQLDFGAERLRLRIKGGEITGWKLRFFYLSGENMEYEFIKKEDYYELEEPVEINHDLPLRMKVCVSGLDIFDVQSALADIRVIRNSDLLPGKDISEEFIYRGQLAAFPQKAEARNICSKRILLGEASGKDYVQTVSESMNIIRSCGLPLEKGNLPYTMSMLYSYPLNQGGLRIELPVFMMPAAEAAADTLKDAEAFLAEWFETNKPKLPGGEIVLSVTFLDRSQQSRVMEFTSLYVSIM